MISTYISRYISVCKREAMVYINIYIYIYIYIYNYRCRHVSVYISAYTHAYVCVHTMPCLLLPCKPRMKPPS